MTSFGKLTNALVHASQETTVTLANLNFDFALIKCEAPAEYKQIGDLLSQKRREAAEDGLVHITARKLGALFGSVIPQVPHLIRAYGQRATEISKMPSANPRASQLYGAFSDYVGADCTTIWATATSGEGVITMHLLACMLARIFDGPKAISIWNELVEQRKEILKREISRVGTSSKLSDAIASRIDIPRDQLASWDASARAWILTADEAKRRQQTQLRLVIDNISLPVSSSSIIYDSIMEAWSNALRAIDDLI